MSEEKKVEEIEEEIKTEVEETAVEETAVEEVVTETEEAAETEETVEAEEVAEAVVVDAEKEVAAVQKKKKDNKKGIILLTACILIFALILSMAGINTSSSSYESDLEAATTEMVTQVYAAITVISARSEYWDDASDSNTLIDEQNAEYFAEMAVGYETLADMMADLKNPPSKYSENYEYLSGMYEGYLLCYELAVNPGTDEYAFLTAASESMAVFMEDYTLMAELYAE